MVSLQLQEVCTNHYPLLLKTARRHVNNPHDAEDICQDVFTVFCTKFHTVTQYKYWLLGSLRLAIKSYRSKEHHKRYRALADIDLCCDCPQTHTRENFGLPIFLEQVLHNIDPTARRLLQLRYIHDWTFKRVADELRMTLRQVSYLHTKTINYLADLFKEQGIYSVRDVL
jgi:RNA polymerase sigma factor (sigma-70 family)